MVGADQDAGHEAGDCKRQVIWHACHGEERVKWLKTGESSLRPSKRKLRAIPLELQELARARGLISSDSDERV